MINWSRKRQFLSLTPRFNLLHRIESSEFISRSSIGISPQAFRINAFNVSAFSGLLAATHRSRRRASCPRFAAGRGTTPSVSRSRFSFLLSSRPRPAATWIPSLNLATVLLTCRSFQHPFSMDRTLANKTLQLTPSHLASLFTTTHPFHPHRHRACSPVRGS